MEELSSTLRRTILLERVGTKPEIDTSDKTEKGIERDDQKEEEGSEERAEKDDDEEEENPSNLSEAKSLPTTEVSTSATGAEEDLEIMVITGLTEGTE